MAAGMGAAPGGGISGGGGGEGLGAAGVRAGGEVRSLTADPNRPQRLYAGTQGDGVFVSEDGGSSWTTAGLGGEVVKALAVDRNGKVLAATKPPALFASKDAGATWTELPALRRMRRWYWWQPAERPHV